MKVLLGTLPAELAERALNQDNNARFGSDDELVAGYSVGWTWSKTPIRSGHCSRWLRNSNRQLADAQ